MVAKLKTKNDGTIVKVNDQELNEINKIVSVLDTFYIISILDIGNALSSPSSECEVCSIAVNSSVFDFRLTTKENLKPVSDSKK